MNPKLKRTILVVAWAILSGGALFALSKTSGLIEALTNYPNPFDSRREATSIVYRIPQDMPVRVGIYDLFGYRVKEFSFAPGDTGGRSGENTIQWDGTDETGQKVSKGGYICLVTVEGGQSARSIRKIGVIH